MTIIKIAEAGYECDVFSFVPCRRSHSVCAQGGINGAVNTKGEGDSPEIHFVDTVKGGDFLANQPPVKAMCYAAPGVIYLLDRMGVPFYAHRRGADRLPPLRRHAAPPHRLRRRHHRPAAALRARRAGAPPRGRGQGAPLRAPRVRRHRQGRRRALPRHRGHGSVDDEARQLPRRRRGAGDGRAGRALRQVDQLGGQHRHRGRRRLSAGRHLRQRRVHPGAPDGHRRPRQAAAHLRVAARRGRARVGAEEEGRHARSADHPARQSAGTSSRRSTPSSRTWCRATSAPARSSRRCATTGWAWGARIRSTSTSSTPTARCPTGAAPTRSPTASRAWSRSTRSSPARTRARRRCWSSRRCITRWAACGSTTIR